jgi:hypothetical protein
MVLWIGNLLASIGALWSVIGLPLVKFFAGLFGGVTP